MRTSSCAFNGFNKEMFWSLDAMIFVVLEITLIQPVLRLCCYNLWASLLG